MPIYDIVVGNGEGEVPLAKLERHLTKLPANITVKQMDSLESGWSRWAPSSVPAAMPKGPLPGAGQDARRAAHGAAQVAATSVTTTDDDGRPTPGA